VNEKRPATKLQTNNMVKGVKNLPV